MRTFGTLRRAGRSWELVAEPHVIIKAKRMLPRAYAQVTGSLAVSDTPEVAIDLEWLLVRYRMRMSLADVQHLQDQGDRHRATEQAIVSIRAGHRLEGDFLKPAVEPRGYQLAASDVLLATGRNLVVHAAGLGKTFTGLLGLREPKARPALVATLGGTLPRQWQAQCARFFPDLTSEILPTGEVSDRVLQRLLAADVLITPYSRLVKYEPHLRGHARYVIFDEIQELRRDGSQKYVAAASLAAGADYVAGLTATPVYGYGGEIFPVVNPLAPGVLGDRSEFIREWAGHAVGMGRNTDLGEVTALGSYLREIGLMDVKTRAEVGMETNEPLVVPYDIDVDTEIIRRAEDSIADVARRILAGGGTPQERFAWGSEMDWKLREATGVAKAPHVADLVRLLLEGEQRVLLFGWHHKVYDIWAELLADCGVARFTGTESPRQKEQAKAGFCGGDARVLMMSLRAGAGIDGLQDWCSVAVFGELDWAPGIHKQNIWRLDRPDWTDNASAADRLVTAYFCTTDDGSDPLMTEVLGIKSQQAGALISSSQNLAESPMLSSADRVRRLAESVLARGK